MKHLGKEAHEQAGGNGAVVTQPDSSGGPLGAARVTLLGTAAEVPAEEVPGVGPKHGWLIADTVGLRAISNE
jgi:hypothetical protein